MKATLDVPAIVARYSAGVGLRKLGIACHCDPERVRGVLVAAGVVIRPVGSNRSSTAPLDINALVARYNEGESVSTLATSIGRGRNALRTAFAAADVPIRPRGIQKAGVKPLWRTCTICDTRIPAVGWHDHQRTTHTAPATPASVIRRNVAAYIAALETKPTPERSHCAGCKQRPCATPLCCGRRLRALTQHANRKEIR